jgi:hypothetical protein
MSTRVYPTQRKMAKHVMTRVKAALRKGHKIQDILICMYMQMGKLGTIVALAELLHKHFKKKSYFISAEPTKILRDQNEEGLEGSYVTYLDKYDLSSSVDEGTLNSMRKEIRPGSILFIDESHIGTSASGMLGSLYPFFVDELKLTIITLTATPFEEQHSKRAADMLVVSANREDFPGYYGITEMLADGNVYDIGDFANPINSRHFIPALEDFISAGENKYFIVRTRSNKDSLELQERLQKGGYSELQFKLYDQQSQENDPNFLIKTPRRPTLVFINNFWRCGKVLNGKENIWGVWESTTGTVTSIVQGLVGRLCGYHKLRNIRVYTSKAAVQWYSTWELSKDKSIGAEELERLGRKKVAQRLTLKVVRDEAQFETKVISMEEVEKLKQKGITVRRLSNIGAQNKNTDAAVRDYTRWRDQALDGFRGSFGTDTDGKWSVYIFDENTRLFPDGDPLLAPIKDAAIMTRRMTSSGVKSVEGAAKNSMYNRPKRYNDKAQSSGNGVIKVG